MSDSLLQLQDSAIFNLHPKEERTAPSVALASLPSDLISEVLFKVHSITLIRMRKTCKRVYEMAERNRRRLASRPDLGIKVKLFDGDEFFPEDWHYGVTTSTVLYFEREYTEAMATERFIVDSSFEKRISGISFSKITLESRGENVDLFLDVMRHLPRHYQNFTAINFPPEAVVQMTDNLRFEQTDQMAFSMSPEQLVSILSKARNRSRLSIVSDCDKVTTNILEKTMNFAHLGVTTSRKEAMNLLWEIYTFKEKISTKWITLRLTNRNYYPVRDPPPHYSFNDIRHEGVFLMFLPLQYALIFWRCQMCEITFLDRNTTEVVRTLSAIYPSVKKEALATKMEHFLYWNAKFGK